MKQIEETENLNFGTYRKVVQTRARILNKADFEIRQGKIVTLEGSISFQEGDFLAQGEEGDEWPIRAETMARTKRRTTEPDSEGWATYINTDNVLATQIHEPFQVKRSNGEIFTGKAGDFLVISGNHKSIVDQTIFNKRYQLVSE